MVDSARMFPGARDKLEDARTILQQLELAADAPAFRSQFNSFLSEARAITYALQKDGAELPGFAEWYAEKQDEMRRDELLKFIHEARIEDFHRGKHKLVFDTYVAYLSTEEAGPPPAPGASFVVGAEGPFWLVDAGIPGERRIPVRAGRFVTAIRIANPPRIHMRSGLQQTDPLSICRLALTYLENLVHEAKSKFTAS